MMFVVPPGQTKMLGRQSYTLSVSYKGDVKATSLHLHVIQVL